MYVRADFDDVVPSVFTGMVVICLGLPPAQHSLSLDLLNSSSHASSLARSTIATLSLAGFQQSAKLRVSSLSGNSNTAELRSEKKSGAAAELGGEVFL